jgi:hypothetical protein
MPISLIKRPSVVGRHSEELARAFDRGRRQFPGGKFFLISFPVKKCGFDRGNSFRPRVGQNLNDRCLGPGWIKFKGVKSGRNLGKPTRPRGSLDC